LPKTTTTAEAASRRTFLLRSLKAVGVGAAILVGLSLAPREAKACC
jgi:hypothetical protein